MIKKILTLFLLIFMCFSFVSAVTVTDTSKAKPTPAPVEKESPYMRMIIVCLIILVVGGVGTFILYWIVSTIIKWIKDNRRKDTDKLFGKFKTKYGLCQIQRDRTMIYKKWWTFWIFSKRHPIYYRDNKGNLNLFGEYEGESKSREGLDLIAYSQSTGFLTRTEYIILIPNALRESVYSKENHFGKNIIILNCEGIDETLSTDYIQMVLVKDKLHATLRKPFIDYSNLIQEDFVKDYFYKDVIKENMLDFKDAMKETVEINPNVQVGRKNPNS